MTNLLLASAVLAAGLAAGPAAPTKPAPGTANTAAVEKKPGADGAKKDLKPPPAKDLSSPALKDAIGSLLGPCSPEMAKAKVTSIEVLDAEQVNTRLEKEKSTKPRAEPGQRFISATYEAGGKKALTTRQVSSHLMLTTEQSQALVGERLCVVLEE